MAYLILFVALFFQILILNKMNNLNSRFVVFKICSQVLFKIIYGSYLYFFLQIEKSILNLGFRHGKFCDNNLLDFISYFS